MNKTIKQQRNGDFYTVVNEGKVQRVQVKPLGGMVYGNGGHKRKGLHGCVGFRCAQTNLPEE